MYHLILSVIFLMSFSTPLFACSEADLARIELIKDKINKDNKGLDLESQNDVADIKLHIAYVLTQKKDCKWSEELEAWYQVELDRLKPYLEQRRINGAKIQQKHRERYKFKNDDNKTDEKIFEKSFYNGINRKTETVSIPSVKIEDKFHLEELVKLNHEVSQFDVISVSKNSSQANIIKYSLAMGHYTQNMNEKGKLELMMVKDNMPLSPSLIKKSVSRNLVLLDPLPLDINPLVSSEYIESSSELMNEFKQRMMQNQLDYEVTIKAESQRRLEAEKERERKIEEARIKKLQQLEGNINATELIKLGNEIKAEMQQGNIQCPTQAKDLNYLKKICQQSLEGKNWHRQVELSKFKKDHKACGFNSLHYIYFVLNFFCDGSKTCYSQGNKTLSNTCNKFERMHDGVLTLIGNNCQGIKSYRSGGTMGDTIIIELLQNIHIECVFEYKNYKTKEGLNIYYSGLILPY